MWTAVQELDRHRAANYAQLFDDARVPVDVRAVTSDAYE
jgi:hypothetical protein